MAINNCYTRLTIETAQVLADLGCADLAIYLPKAGCEEPVLYRQARAGLDGPDYRRLHDHGVSTLFVPSDALHEHDSYLENNLAALLRKGGLEPVAKAEVIQHVGQSVAAGLVQQPAQGVDLERTTQFVDEIVGCVLSEPSVAPYLAHMSAHHRSTAGHMVIVSMLAVMLGARVYGDDRQALRDLGLAGMLHDIGKLAIDPAVLGKPGRLSPEETTLIQQHPIEAVRLLGDHPQATSAVRRMIIEHHERVDGRGYPLGRTGDDLEVGSKILTLVDSFHAITGPRAYRAALTSLETNRVLNALGGRQFDPDLLACWNSLFEGRDVRPPGDWAVQGSERVEDELASQHEHRASDSRRTDLRYRPPRSACNGRIRAACVYAGRLKGVTSAPDRFDCTVQDVSRLGICLRTHHPLFRGEVVHVLPKGTDSPIWIEGVVAWCRQQKDGRGFRCGVRFASRIREDQVGQCCDVERMEWTVAQSA